MVQSLLVPPFSTVSRVEIHKINLFSILNHSERYEENELKIGILLGDVDADEKCVVSDACFAINVLEELMDEDSPQQDVLPPTLNNDQLNMLLNLHLRINPNYKIVGWYHIGNNIDQDGIAFIHKQIQAETGEFDAVYLHVDLDLLQVATSFPLSFYVGADASLPGAEEKDIIFLPIAHTVVGESSTFRDGASLNKGNTSNIKSLSESLETVQSLIATLQEYIAANADKPVNLPLAQAISDAIAIIDTYNLPLAPDAFSKVVRDRHISDLEMVDRLGSVCKRLVNAASGLQNAVSATI